MNILRTLMIGLIAAVLIDVSAHATPIINDATGLASPEVLEDFGAHEYADSFVCTVQYLASSGISFGATYFYETSTTTPISSRDEGFLFTDASAQPGSIFFAQTVNKVAFGMRTNPGMTTFSAYLGGVLVESFTTATGLGGTGSDYYGFTGIAFDEIRMEVDAADFLVNIDNIQYTTPVPEPSTAVLLALGLLGLVVGRRRGASVRR